jgi:hypothetical protein
MSTEDQDLDEELEPRKLWDMTPEQVKIWLEREKKKRKKMAKNWRPLTH